MYKSKLQEMCVVKSWSYPKYSTTKYGPDHSPCFTASVFVNGTSFDSSTFCKSMKEAHNKAAEAALIHFISLSSARSPYIPSPAPVSSEKGLKMMETSKHMLPAEVEEEVPKTEPELKKKQEERESNATILVKSCNLKNSKSVADPQEKEIEAAKINMNLLSLEDATQDTGPKSVQGGASKSKRHGKINPVEDDGSFSIKGEGKLMSKNSTDSVEKSLDTRKQKDPEMTRFLLGNRVRAYSYVPEIANLPKGVTVLQVCENKWVAVSLDFPNEKGN